MVKKYYLTSLGGFILSIILALLSTITFILLIIYANEVGIFSIIFSLFFVVFALFGLFLCFCNCIKIDFDKETIKIITLRIRKIAFHELFDVYITIENTVDKKKYCHLIFKKYNGEEIVINGIVSVFKYKDVEKTKILLNKIKTDLTNKLI